MALSDGIRQTAMFIAMLVILLYTGEEVVARGYQGTAVVLLVLATWLVMFCSSRFLPPVYRYHTLRIKSQVCCLKVKGKCEIYNLQQSERAFAIYTQADLLLCSMIMHSYCTMWMLLSLGHASWSRGNP